MTRTEPDRTRAVEALRTGGRTRTVVRGGKRVGGWTHEALARTFPSARFRARLAKAQPDGPNHQRDIASAQPQCGTPVAAIAGARKQCWERCLSRASHPRLARPLMTDWLLLMLMLLLLSATSILSCHDHCCRRCWLSRWCSAGRGRGPMLLGRKKDEAERTRRAGHPPGPGPVFPA